MPTLGSKEIGRQEIEWQQLPPNRRSKLTLRCARRECHRGRCSDVRLLRSKAFLMTALPMKRRFHQTSDPRPSGRDALQALLAFSAMHQQVRQRRALASRRNGFETIAQAHEFEPREQFVLDEVLQLVAERAIAITGADGLGIALAENNEIVLRASAGAIKPDVGQRIQRDSAFSGACFRTAQIIRCDDTETDDRVNLYCVPATKGAVDGRGAAVRAAARDRPAGSFLVRAFRIQRQRRRQP